MRLRLPSEVSRLTYSKDGRYLAIACSDETALVYDLLDGNVKKFRRDLHGFDAVISNDGQHLALLSLSDSESSETARRLRIFNVHDGTEISNTGWDTIGPNAHEDWPSLVVFSPDDKFLAYASSDTLVAIRSFPDGQLWWELELETRGRIVRLEWSPDGRYLAVVNTNRTMAVFDLQNRSELPKAT